MPRSGTTTPPVTCPSSCSSTAWPATRLEWGATIAALRSDHRVIAVEQRGHGSSTRRPADVSRTAYVADVVAVLDDLGVAAGVPWWASRWAATPRCCSRPATPSASAGWSWSRPASAAVAPPTSTASRPGCAAGRAPFPDRDAFLTFFGGSRAVAEGWADGLEERTDGLWPQWDPEVLVRANRGGGRPRVPRRVVGGARADAAGPRRARLGARAAGGEHERAATVDRARGRLRRRARPPPRGARGA